MAENRLMHTGSDFRRFTVCMKYKQMPFRSQRYEVGAIWRLPTTALCSWRRS